ncbi:DUF4041 domain-containing protein [Nocardioides litoris]|uniref:DUF4041 domain-containing protein n=1 Tax=Nocardioides litoris TaxID=1926648 RepID=UPI0011207AC7|nr:DUF4041 domain-containing protein [Nocardioides litoris]
MSPLDLTRADAPEPLPFHTPPDNLGYCAERPGWAIGTPRPPGYDPARHTPSARPKLTDTDAEQLHAVQTKLAAREDELTTLRAALATARARERNLTQQLTATGETPLAELDDDVVLQEVGIYRYHHPLEDAAAYKQHLDELNTRIKQCIKDGDAVESSDRFVFNNSLAQGRKMTADLSRLMLRAYNAEADTCLRTMRAGNVTTAKTRLERTLTSISKLGALMELRVSPAFHALRIEELELTADYLFRLQEEREQAKEERARLREQRREEEKLQAERAKLDKERLHQQNALDELRRQGRDDEAAAIEHRLAQIDDAIAQTDYRIANQRAGYVYVISNVGAFGPGIVKIGLTRRLEPLERIAELNGASVPFPFDVHVLFFSDDAVTLENQLHTAFAARRLNLVNQRREFFFATPAEVRDELVKKVGNLLQFVISPEALQYHQSRPGWQRD